MSEDVSNEAVENAFRTLNKLCDEAGLQFHEVLAMSHAIRILDKRIDSEQCRFNCRTAKYHYQNGFKDALRQVNLNLDVDSAWLAYKYRKQI